MEGLRCSLAVSGTVLPREGAAPLLAVEATHNGALVSAFVVDPSDVGSELASVHERSLEA